ncbi:MAG: hypothetical protein KDK70_23530, partial [Myxococcales bacterium]|nr:hypothetical protein [Myxococcales bacterium]
GLAGLAGVIVALGVCTQAQAIGEEVDGFPSWEERVYLQLTNRARVDPQVEMAVCGDDCPDAACYTPQPPLRHDPTLARSSRFHAQEMEVRGFCAHTSNCTLVDDIAERWPDTCDGSADCACVGGVAECTGSCTSAQSRVSLFGAGYGGEVSVGVSDPHWGFYLWLHEPSTSEQCVFGNGNGHRWLLLTSQGRVGFGAYGGYGNGDFGFGGASDAYEIPSGAHYPRTGSTVVASANWHADAPPSLTTVDVDGTCQPLTLERGDALNGTYTRELDGLDPQGCHRYFFVFKDEAGQTLTYPSTGSLGIGPAASCDAWSPERPPQGEGCECTPSCDGLSCGDDGCGGSCGSCGDGQACDQGACVDLPPEPMEPTDDGGTGADGGDTDGDGPQDSTDGGGLDGGDTDGDGGDGLDPGQGESGGALPPGYGGDRPGALGCAIASRPAGRGGWLLLPLLLGLRLRRRRSAP